MSGNSRMVHFAEISQSSPSMLKHIERIATPKLPPRNRLRYQQQTLIVGWGGGGVSRRIYVKYCDLITGIWDGERINFPETLASIG